MSQVTLSDFVAQLLGDGLLPVDLPQILLNAPDGEAGFSQSPMPATLKEPGEKFSLFGVNVQLVGEIGLTVSLTEDENKNNWLELTADVAAGGVLTLSSPLAWARQLGVHVLREIQNDALAKSTAPPKDVIGVTLTATKDATAVLIKKQLGSTNAGSFLQQSSDASEPLDPGLWEVSGTFDPGKSGLTFPFLRQSGGGPDSHQSVAFNSTDSPLEFKFDSGVATLQVPASVTFAGVDFACDIPVKFDIQNFALSLDLEDIEGLKILTQKPAIEQNIFGLSWVFSGAKDGEKYHLFTLLTKDFDYKFQQAPDSRIEISYTKASKDPIVFAVSDFEVSDKGLTVTADVLDRPARLNGIDTKYTFAGSSLRVVENEVLGFTLSGSGPLPPKLVGDAMADISLQFESVDDELALVAGAAQVRGDKLLSCESTRFQFQIDALGLKFVIEEGIHLYFTLTGSARFVLGKGDSKSGALAMLPTIELELNECPLTGDASEIAKHVSFLVELPKPVSFPLLGAYEYELRAIGFLPQFEVFDDAAMLLSGQIKFAQGKGDTQDPKPDYHKLYIGLPEEGSFIPRVYMDQLPLAINIGDAFKLNGVVEFHDTDDKKGFDGEGVLEIKGMPPIAASFGFFRMRKDENSPYVRAWFLYLEVRHVSFKMPVVEIFLREVGLGFGYRFTLVSIKAADKSNDLKQLLGELRALSRTQGDLAKRDAWVPDLEDAGADPRFTIVMRAMFSQLTAATSPLQWKEEAERKLKNAFLFDVVAAIRSDLTFFMTARAWINTSYGHYEEMERNLEPLFSGFVLLTPRKKRLLAQVSSNPAGFLGNNPKLPEMVEEAIRGGQFSATFLLEPGLVHYELGWPNMLRWTMKKGPLTIDQRGGFIFRVSTTEMVIGASYLARGNLDIKAEVNLGLVGASLHAVAHIAFGARLTAVIEFEKKNQVSVYGALGLDLRIAVDISLWIKIPLLFVTLELSFSFHFELGFSAAVELGLSGTELGVRGYGTVAVNLMGHSLTFGVHVTVDPDNVVDKARAITEPFLNIGLEASDVDTIPGVQASGAARQAQARRPNAPRRAAMRTINAPPRVNPVGSPAADVAVGQAGEPSPAGDANEPNIREMPLPPERGFTAPNYSVFALRRVPDDEHCYFVLLPGAHEGFLPPPPQDSATTMDFHLQFPDDLRVDGIERFDPNRSDKGEFVAVTRDHQWQARWDAVVIPAPKEYGEDYASKNDSSEEWRTLDAYLGQAFRNEASMTVGETLIRVTTSTRVLDAAGVATVFSDIKEGVTVHVAGRMPNDVLIAREIRLGANGDVKQGEQSKTGPASSIVPIGPVGDPSLLDVGREVEDSRVQNPTDSAFESAVRGAVEQFDGSPFFKLDPTIEFDRALQEAFDPQRNPFGDDASQSDDAPPPHQTNATEEAEQIHQVRGLIINELVRDVQDNYLHGDRTVTQTESIPFQMGLVFRVPRADMPEWLKKKDAQAPTLAQRTSRDADTFSQPEALSTFNVTATDFGENPPEFQSVRHYTDASTIAVAWKLAFHEDSVEGLASHQQDPEHHLDHYEVRRRDLSGKSREVVFSVKGADVIHRDSDTLKRLRPRFQLVDPFHDESAANLAALPAQGRRYLYSITPIDVAGNRGQPLSLVATRYPNEPPRVPVDAELCVKYTLSEADIERPGPGSEPRVVTPRLLELTWTEPTPATGAPAVGIDKYLLVFRREDTLPIGSYGLDSTTNRPPSKLLPVSNARSLSSDIVLAVTPTGPSGDRLATIDVARLQNLGIFPAAEPGGDAPLWRPESWRIFVQTVSKNNVPSALAPAQIVLKVETQGSALRGVMEERRPAELEWLARPMALPMIPPEDQTATLGNAHVPMPLLNAAMSLDDESPDVLASVHFRAHPQALRCIRLRWNQGSSSDPRAPLDLTAGYDLLELDVDAHTTETFENPALLVNALRDVQEVQMLPADDQLFAPGDTLTTSQWEAWYPSAVQRLGDGGSRPLPGAEEPRPEPRHTWRESLLVWPPWTKPGNKEAIGDVARDTQLHPLLDAVIHRLRALREPENPDGPPTYIVEVQTSPPCQPGNFSDFLRTTTADADPYGWSVLQRFGLSVTLSVRRKSDGQWIVQRGLIELLRGVFKMLMSDDDDLRSHLHVELLFQPGKAIELGEGEAQQDALLAIVQVSLRPTLEQRLRYGRVDVSGTPRERVKLTINAPAKTPCSAFLVSDPDRGQIEIARNEKVEFELAIPGSGQARVLWRGASAPIITAVRPAEGSAAPVSLPVTTSGPDDNLLHLADYFTVSIDTLATAFAKSDSSAASEWKKLKWYADGLTPGSADGPVRKDEKGETVADQRIDLPTDADGIAELLGDYLPWAQRFFDHGGPVAPGSDGLAETDKNGPWLATAYPRVEGPAHATPDDGGRLTYNHLLRDKWAHNLRYYIQPYSRYGLLWRSMLRSPTLFPADVRRSSDAEQSAIVDLRDAALMCANRIEQRLPDPNAGGLDVVIERTKAIDRPLVLSSARLDPPSVPGKPGAPGGIWEAVIAQHYEQSLSERNQTVARRLSFRHVSFTLLQTFARASYVDDIATAMRFEKINLVPTEDVRPNDLPGEYGSPDHLNLEKLTDDDQRSLDLPVRVGNFDQGVMALQWQGLPFFYEHVLFVVAQSADTVSPVNRVVQKDFQYRSPAPKAFTQGGRFGEQDDPQPSQGYGLRLPLRRLFDSMPDGAQKKWPAEEPGAGDALVADTNQIRLRPGALPDPEVVYQIALIAAGNLEVQCEVSLVRDKGTVEEPLQPAFQVRALGRKLDVAILDGFWSQPELSYVLQLSMVEKSELRLANDLAIDEVPIANMPHAVEAIKNEAGQRSGSTLSLSGVLTRRQADDLLLSFAAPLSTLVERIELDDGASNAERGALLDKWYGSGLLPEPANIPDSAHDGLGVDHVVSLSQPLDANLSALLADQLTVPNSEDDIQRTPVDAGMRRSLQRLANVTAPDENTYFTERSLVVDDDILSSGLHEDVQAQIELMDDDATMIFSGFLANDSDHALGRIFSSDAVDTLVAGHTVHVDYTAKAPAAPAQLDFPGTNDPEGPAHLKTSRDDDAVWSIEWGGDVAKTRLNLAEELGTIAQSLDDKNVPVDAASKLLGDILRAQTLRIATYSQDEMRWDAVDRVISAVRTFAARPGEVTPEATLPRDEEIVDRLREVGESTGLLEIDDTLAQQLKDPFSIENDDPRFLFGLQSITVQVEWRVTQARVDAAFEDSGMRGPRVPTDASLPMTWRAQQTFDADKARTAIENGIDDEQFRTAFSDLAARMARLMGELEASQLKTSVQYGIAQASLPDALGAALNVAAPLLRLDASLTEEQQTTLREQWSGLNLELLNRLLDDQLDRQTLDDAVHSWQYAEPFEPDDRIDASQLPEGFTLSATSDELRYQGIMTAPEAQAVQDLCTNENNKQAVRGLRDASNNGRADAQIKIATRRGAAPPSALTSFTPENEKSEVEA